MHSTNDHVPQTERLQGEQLQPTLACVVCDRCLADSDLKMHPSHRGVKMNNINLGEDVCLNKVLLSNFRR